jgi:amino acid transporter
MVPVSGSAYTYTYATFGELAAWFIGWMLVLEYGVSASAVAVSWTGYFLSLLDHFGMHLPAALVNAPLDGKLQRTGAIANLPAAGIVLLLTWLCYVGIRKSSAMNMANATALAVSIWRYSTGEGLVITGALRMIRGGTRLTTFSSFSGAGLAAGLATGFLAAGFFAAGFLVTGFLATGALTAGVLVFLVAMITPP